MEMLAIIAILPIIILCIYIYRKDKDKEPAALLRKVFIFGILSVIPIMIIELFVSETISVSDNYNLISLFIAVLVGVALIEELFKWLVVYLKVYNHKEFNHAYDAVVYCVFSSLGFALVENLLFVFQNGFAVGLLRAFLTVPSHTCNGVIMGYFMGKAKQEEYKGNQKLSNRYMFYSLLTPILTHAIYDYLILADRPLCYVLFVIFILFIYIGTFKLVKKISDINYNFDGTPATYKTIDEIKVLEGNGPQKNVNALESAYSAINKTIYTCLGAIIIAIICLMLYK